jgi:hypothetical protein
MVHRTVRLLVVLTFTLSCLPGLCQENRCEEKRVKVAKDLVRERSGFQLPLHAALSPRLGEDIIYLLEKQETRIATHLPTIEFYKVLPAMYDLRDGKIISESVELDSEREWLVALDAQTDRQFLLEGSANPASDFNDLVKNLVLKVSDNDSALRVFDFYVKVALGEQFRSHVVGDEMKLESVALDDFRLRFQASKRRSEFERWWNRIPIKVKKDIGPPVSVPIERGFEVRFFLYSRGEISVERVIIAKDGTVVQGEPKLLVSGS